MLRRALRVLPVLWLVAAAGAGAVPVDVYLDLRYLPGGATPASLAYLNNLDIYAPQGCEACPVVVFVHGGTWIQGGKGRFDDKTRAFAERGWVYVSINYRLSPDVRHPAHVQDAAAAVAWIHDNIGRFGGDPARVCLLGHSAGAHLAALLAADPRYLEAHGLGPQALRAVVGLDSGAYDLPLLFASEPENQMFFEMAFGPDPAVWAAASPVNHPAPGRNTPAFLLIYAGDREVSRQAAFSMAAALQRAGTVAELLHVPEGDHVGVERNLGAPHPAGDALMDRIVAFLETALGPRELP